MTEDTHKEESQHDATIEAILFMHGVPVKLARLSEIMVLSLDEVREAVQKLKNRYEETGSGLAVLVKDDKAQIVTHKTQADIIETFIKKELEGDLSQAALEVLAVVAYRGPLSKPDVEAVRGVNCAFTLRNLQLRGLVEHVAHPTDKRTRLYRVTMDFVRSMGMTTMEDLPHFAELAGDKRIDAILYAGHDDIEGSDENEEKE